MTSYGIFTVLLFIVAAGIIIVAVNPIINGVTDVVNPEISDGALSSKYVTYYNLAVGLGKGVAVFTLIGVAGWGIVRALEKRNQGDY